MSIAVDRYTITLDTIGQTNSNTFTVYLNEPLKNVVQAKLLAAHIHTTGDVEHCYVSIDELDTLFCSRAKSNFVSQGPMSTVNRSFASLISENVAHTGSNQLIIYKRSNYPIEHTYTSPIRRVDRLTVTLRDQDGNTLPPPTGAPRENFLVLDIACQSPAIIMP